MGIISLLISAVFLFFSIMENRKKILHPSVLFLLLWTFILLLANLNLYNIYKPSDTAYLLILLMIIFFLIGNFTAKYILKNKKKNTCNKKIKIRYYVIYILAFFLIVFTLIDCFIVIKSFLNGTPMYEIRRWRMGTFGVDINPILSRRTFIEEAFRSIILTPFETLLPPFAAYLFFNPEKSIHKKYIVSISLLSLILSSVAGGGGRLGFIYYFGCYLISFIAFSKKNKEMVNFKKYRKVILSLMISGVVITILFTQIRTSASFIKQTYTYFALPPTLLSLWLPKLENIHHTYGLLTTFGIHSYFFRTLDTLHMNFLVPQIYNDTFQHLLNAEIFMQTGYGVGNAFVTPIYYFFIDGGYIFVCLASLIFGILIQKQYEKMNHNFNIKNFMIYALIMYGVFLTFIRIQTAIPSYVIAFIMVHLLFYNSKEEKYE